MDRIIPKSQKMEILRGNVRFMCDFCKARELEIKKGNYVTSQIFVIDKKTKEKFSYLLFDLNYCPNCGKKLKQNNE